MSSMSSKRCLGVHRAYGAYHADRAGDGCCNAGSLLPAADLDVKQHGQHGCEHRDGGLHACGDQHATEIDADDVAQLVEEQAGAQACNGQHVLLLR